MLDWINSLKKKSIKYKDLFHWRKIPKITAIRLRSNTIFNAIENGF